MKKQVKFGVFADLHVDIMHDAQERLEKFLEDCRKEDVKVGMAVRPTFRKLFQENGVHTYFWKVVPEEQEESK